MCVKEQIMHPFYLPHRNFQRAAGILAVCTTVNTKFMFKTPEFIIAHTYIKHFALPVTLPNMCTFLCGLYYYWYFTQ
jgi:hypothetical protein